jgi:hypothetical protein|tara:strand:+ start:134 stop:253 length:120 start_codon:yes stop_codon:yes gene_type:complete
MDLDTLGLDPQHLTIPLTWAMPGDLEGEGVGVVWAFAGL